jgi:hypothetical protein
MSLLRAVGEYLTAMCADMLSRISGICGVILLLIAGFVKLSEQGEAKYWLCAAFGCYVIAAFKVWYNTRSDLRIKIRQVTAHLNAFKFSRLDPISTLVILELYLVSTRPEPNAIEEYALHISMYNGRQLRGRNVSLKGLQWGRTGRKLIDLESVKDEPLTQGRPVVGHVGFSVNIDDEEKLSGERLVLTVTDVYNVSRKIKATIQTEGADFLDRTPPPYMNEAYRS